MTFEKFPERVVVTCKVTLHELLALTRMPEKKALVALAAAVVDPAGQVVAKPGGE